MGVEGGNGAPFSIPWSRAGCQASKGSQSYGCQPTAAEGPVRPYMEGVSRAQARWLYMGQGTRESSVEIQKAGILSSKSCGVVD